MQPLFIKRIIQLTPAAGQTQNRDSQPVLFGQHRIFIDVHRGPANAGSLQQRNYLLAEMTVWAQVQNQWLVGFHRGILTGYNLDSNDSRCGCCMKSYYKETARGGPAVNVIEC